VVGYVEDPAAFNDIANLRFSTERKIVTKESINLLLTQSEGEKIKSVVTNYLKFEH